MPDSNASSSDSNGSREHAGRPAGHHTMSIKATIGRFLLLGSTDVRWELRAGVAPYEVEVDMIPKDARELLKEGLLPQTLTLDDGRGRMVTG